MRIYIHIVQDLSLEVESTDSIESIKKQIQYKTGIHTNTQSVQSMSHHDILSDKGILKNYNIQKDDILDVYIYEKNEKINF